jgi:hypothetical protein
MTGVKRGEELSSRNPFAAHRRLGGYTFPDFGMTETHIYGAFRSSIAMIPLQQSNGSTQPTSASEFAAPELCLERLLHKQQRRKVIPENLKFWRNANAEEQQERNRKRNRAIDQF